MQQPASRRRRKLVLISAGVAAAAIGGFVASRGGARDDRDLRFASLADARAELARLARGQTPISPRSWSWVQTVVHCAQSIEYSMTGFPQMKPALFQRTVGSAAMKRIAPQRQLRREDVGSAERRSGPGAFMASQNATNTAPRIG